MTRTKKGIFSIFLAVVLLLCPMLLMACGEEPEEGHYNIVLTNATVPPMMATLSCLESDDTTYMWYGRQQTFTNPEKLGFEMLENNNAPSVSAFLQRL